MALTVTVAGWAITVPDDLAAEICAVGKSEAVPIASQWLGIDTSIAGPVVDQIHAQCKAPPPPAILTPGPMGVPWIVWALGAGGLVWYLSSRR